MRNNEIKNERDDIKKCEKKVNEKTQYIEQINVTMIFNNMKR